jgi:putative Mg2+ transporter-C (MgtC) family protein
MDELLSFDWQQAVEDLVRVFLAFALGLPLGWERIQTRPKIGLRTFPIVAMASCGYVLMVRSLPGMTPEAEARIVQGLLSGIGFIGGGAILQQGRRVTGLATAASIWVTGAIGAAVAFRRIEIAVILAIINFMTLYFLSPYVERNRKKERERLREEEEQRHRELD